METLSNEETKSFLNKNPTIGINLSDDNEFLDLSHDSIIRERHFLVNHTNCNNSEYISGEVPKLDDHDLYLTAKQAEQFMQKVFGGSWKVHHFSTLPKWLQDNDFLHKGHRPPLQSFKACFQSIFRIHTETGNIWTHLLGCLLFVGIAIYFLSQPSHLVSFEEKIIFATFFVSIIICLGLSSAFHTVNCHSEPIGKLFSKLDYCGIALLITGSFVPWLYYTFYCDALLKLLYFALVLVLASTSVIVSCWDKFSEPEFRWLRAAVFAGFGLSGVIPALHFLIVKGFFHAVYRASFGWLVLMAILYLLGATFYASRIPERFFPGRCDIWFQSHQIFHILVIVAAIVHYHGISVLAIHKISDNACSKRQEKINMLI